MVLVDAHVHFYDEFDPSRFLVMAAENFRRAGKRLGLPGVPPGFLLFTEAAGQRRFEWFRRMLQQQMPSGWRVQSTAEDCSLVVTGDGTAPLVLVEGRQVKSAQGLEVLAPASREEFPDGLSLHETWRLVRDSGAMAILPWGFGKWWLARGHLVRALVDSARPHELYLGDGAGRPRAAPRPAIFDEAAARGILDLPGTDPFPLRSHEDRAGSFGFVFDGDVDFGSPAESLVRGIRALRAQPRRYGRGESLVGFGTSQMGLRLATRRRRHRARLADLAADREARVTSEP